MNSRLKISVLHLISSSAFLGAERVVCELAACLDPLIFNLQVGLLGSPQEVVKTFSKALEGTTASVVEFPCDGKISLFSIMKIKKYVDSNNISIVHSHGYKSDIYAMLASLSSSNDVATIATNHNWITSSLKERVYKIIDSLVLRQFNMVVAVSDILKDEIVDKGIKVERANVIANGINVAGDILHDAYKATRIQLGLLDTHFVIGCVASLTHEKAHTDLLQAFALVVKSVPDSRLVIVGSGFLDDDLRSLSFALGIEENVIFTGYRNDARALYIAFDVFALVSHSEGLPMAMLEAMAASLPVVVSAVGAIPKVVTTMENGILITPGDINAIANSIIKLALDPALRESLGSKARSEVVANYSVNRMARDYEQLYEKVLASKP